MNTLPNPIAGTWVDSEIDWAETHTKLSEADVDRFIAERTPVPPMPAEACTELGAETENFSGFWLEPYLTRHSWLGPTLVALVCFVWLCADGYLANLP